MKQKIISEIMTDITILLLVVVGILNIVRFHIIEKAIEQLQYKVDYAECTTSGGILVDNRCLYCDIYSKGFELCYFSNNK